jgi:hypothetical protein
MGMPARRTQSEAFRVVSNNPGVARVAFGQLMQLLENNNFDTRLRELMIMRICRLQVRTRLAAGGRWIRTLGPPVEDGASIAANVSSSMARAKLTPRISAPSAAPVGTISIDISGSPAGQAALSRRASRRNRRERTRHMPIRAPPESGCARAGNAAACRWVGRL